MKKLIERVKSIISKNPVLTEEERFFEDYTKEQRQCLHKWVFIYNPFFITHFWNKFPKHIEKR